ncbi:MAG: NPCBM/NEW2 domain-containing protein [Verrucomicrobiota bacterium]
MPRSLLGVLVFSAALQVAVSAYSEDLAVSPRREMLPSEPTLQDLDRARTLLETWENESPAKTKRLMRICYWTPQDREPQPDYRARLTRVMQHIQAFYLREMTAWGFPGRSIQLDLEEDSLLHLHMVKGTLKSDECSEADGKDGRDIRKDCLKALSEAGIDGEKETIVIFCNLAEWDAAKRTMSHHSPYYASGNSQGGTAWQVDSPLLDSALLPVRDQHLQDRQYGRISLGRYNSIFVGGVCHELGHALGLPHCKECSPARRLRGTALMGSGNRTYGNELREEDKGSFLSLPHALKLAAHPQFSGSVKQIATPLKASFDDWQLKPTSDGLHVTAALKSDLPVHAVLAYADPAGGGDYDSEIAAAIPDEKGRITLTLPTPEHKKTTTALHFVAVAVNGAATAGVWSSQAYTMNARITADGAYDVSKAVQKLEFDKHWPNFKDGKINEDSLSKLSPDVQPLIRRLRAPDTAKDKPSPAAADAATHTLALSDAAPLKAVTGWSGVHYDRTPEGGPLIGPEGLINHGLYAHADSTYEYDLAGKWQTFSGSACLLDKGYGPVEATILGDGRELWKSSTLKSGDTKLFKVDVQGIQKLTLRIQGKDGISGAWGAWAEPTLERAN